MENNVFELIGEAFKKGIRPKILIIPENIKNDLERKINDDCSTRWQTFMKIVCHLRDSEGRMLFLYIGISKLTDKILVL